MVRSEGGGLLVLHKGGECRVTPRFHLLVSDVNQGKEKTGWIQDFLVWPQEWKDSPLIFCKMLNMWWGVGMFGIFNRRPVLGETCVTL